MKMQREDPRLHFHQGRGLIHHARQFHHRIRICPVVRTTTFRESAPLRSVRRICAASPPLPVAPFALESVILASGLVNAIWSSLTESSPAPNSATRSSTEMPGPNATVSTTTSRPGGEPLVEYRPRF